MKARNASLLACAVTIIVAATIVASSQAPGSFAGQWVLTSISPQRPAYDQFWFGTEARVTQTETTLVIARVSPPPQREARFTFGAESRNEYVVNGQKLVRDSRVTLSRDTLLISTDTTPADGERWLSNILRWSLDPDGTLVVGDTEICGKGECPSVVTTLKFNRRAASLRRPNKRTEKREERQILLSPFSCLLYTMIAAVA